MAVFFFALGYSFTIHLIGFIENKGCHLTTFVCVSKLYKGFVKFYDKKKASEKGN